MEDFGYKGGIENVGSQKNFEISREVEEFLVSRGWGSMGGWPIFRIQGDDNFQVGFRPPRTLCLKIIVSFVKISQFIEL